jgi:hypothetical protein
MTVANASRLPGVVIVGAMKAATTSLYRWLDEQPEVFMAHPKETRFFSDKWERGLDWYAGFFKAAAQGQLLGEASVNYTNPDMAPTAAERMGTTIPHARLIYIVRHPVQRIRSHYRHEVQRRRETRSLMDALRDPANPYAGHSSYYTCLRPYIGRFPREQILVVRFEDLIRPPTHAWSSVLRFLAMEQRPVPKGSYNVSNEKGQWTRTMAWAKRNRLISLQQVSRLPEPVRRMGKVIFARGGQRYERKLEDSAVPIPNELVAPVWDDVARLEAWLGLPLWGRDNEMLRRETTG